MTRTLPSALLTRLAFLLFSFWFVLFFVLWHFIFANWINFTRCYLTEIFVRTIRYLSSIPSRIHSFHFALWCICRTNLTTCFEILAFTSDRLREARFFRIHIDFNLYIFLGANLLWTCTCWMLRQCGKTHWHLFKSYGFSAIYKRIYPTRRTTMHHYPWYTFIWGLLRKRFVMSRHRDNNFRKNIILNDFL